MADGDVFQILFKTQQPALQTLDTSAAPTIPHNPPVPIIVTMIIIVTNFLIVLNNGMIMTRVMIMKV